MQYNKECGNYSIKTCIKKIVDAKQAYSYCLHISVQTAGWLSVCQDGKGQNEVKVQQNNPVVANSG